jgi:hypothetical protein
MFRFLSVCAVCVFANSVCAADEPKPNSLTAKEIAEGWILLFDGETTYGWSAVKEKDDKKDELTAKDGVLTLTGKGRSFAFSTHFGYFEFNGEYRTTTRGNQISIAQLNGKAPALRTSIAPQLLPNQTNVWKKLTFRVVPQDGIQKVTVLSDDIEKQNEGIRIAGENCMWEINCHIFEEGEARLELRNLKLKPTETKPLFNGKDLDGWSVNKADPKRMVSKWEVTKEGELSLKNGPGDLVSEKEFDNFVLQLECKTLGDALNSGVFFRNIPGQYQNGYEVQIQNSYKVGDRTKPFDFGTGAIYRRIPARKVVSNDNEWFTMTVVAEGKHIATWVNGYQTVDWIDDRPADENPRKGYRAAKGPLSLQGHDPSTNLLFRNIRIAELPVEKK